MYRKWKSQYSTSDIQESIVEFTQTVGWKLGSINTRVFLNINYHHHILKDVLIDHKI